MEQLMKHDLLIQFILCRNHQSGAENAIHKSTRKSRYFYNSAELDSMRCCKGLNVAAPFFAWFIPPSHSTMQLHVGNRIREQVNHDAKDVENKKPVKLSSPTR